MPIKLHCPACNASMVAPDELAGKKAKCAKCKSPVTIPSAKSDELTSDGLAGDSAPAKPLDAPTPAADLDWNSLASMEAQAEAADLEFSLPCPHCKAEFNARESQRGTEVTCTWCGGLVMAPVPDTLSAPAGDTLKDFAAKATERDSRQGAGIRQSLPMTGGWRTARVGLTIVYICSFAIAVLAGIVAATLGGLFPWFLPVLVSGQAYPSFSFLVGFMFSLAAPGITIHLWHRDVPNLPMIASLLGMFVVVFWMGALSMNLVLAWLAELLFGGVLILAVAGVGLLVGKCMAIAAPAPGALRWFAIGSVAATILGILTHSITTYTLVSGGARLDALEAGWIRIGVNGASFFFTLSHVLFTLFLRGIAKLCNDEPTLEAVTTYLILWGGAFVVNTLYGVLLAFGAFSAHGAAAAALLPFIISIAAIMSFQRCVGAVAALIR